MSLREKIKGLSGNKRRFLLLRTADIDTKAALKLIGVVRGTYNSWLQGEEFVTLYREVRKLTDEYKQEAIQLLRRDNQLEAVLLEGKIIAEMKQELKDRKYDLIRTNLAKEVYTRLLSDLDKTPTTPLISWEQRIANIFTNPPEQIVEGSYTEVNEEAQ